jgi:ribose 5-phosphate isomerase B
MNISIGNDHAGVKFKKAIIQHLEKKGNVLKNHGTDDKISVDYPDFIHPVAQDVEEDRATFGIIICGSGNGAAMTANKHQKIRAGLCWNKKTAKLIRQHNDANIISLPARFISLELALEMVDIFIETPFERGRHQNRVNKIAWS